MPVPSPSASSTPSSSHVRSSPDEDSLDVPAADITHMDLVLHLLSWDDDAADAADFFPRTQRLISVRDVVRAGLGCDFLMNELLAFSARHLAATTVAPDLAASYLHRASCLQTHALSLFTRARVRPSRDNCLHLVYFSWVLGTHLLCDVPNSSAGDPTATLTGFLRYLEVYRGLRAVMTGAWRFVLESEHGALFRDGEAAAGNLGKGGHTRELEALVMDSLGLDDGEKEGCREALARVQWAFDVRDGKTTAADDDGGDGDDERSKVLHYFTMAFSWPLLVTPEFLACVQRRRPEGLLVLAHFAAVLSWCRRHWIFGEVGARLLESIVCALGPGWERWLQWSKENVEVG